MGISKDYFKRLFGRLNVRRSSEGFFINLDFSAFGEKIDYAQDILDEQVWQDIQMYMPHDTGALISETNALNASTRGEVYLYPPYSDYGHYQYEGVIYEDPKYHVGGFYTEGYGWWSRPGVKKKKSDRPLFYTQPNAEAHWDEVAQQNHEKDWIKLVKRVLS